MDMDMGMESENSLPLAVRACSSCKASKKKCDKKLPQCTRCTRLTLNCSYDEAVEHPEVTGESKFDEILRRLDRIEVHVSRPETTEKPIAVSKSTKASDTDSVEPGSTSPRVYQFNPALLSPSYMAIILEMNVLRVLETNHMSLEAIGEQYYRTIDKWLPIIPEQKLLQVVECQKTMIPAGEFVLGALCMVLVTAPPTYFAGLPHEDSDLYRNCKYHYSLFLSLGEPSIDLIQAGILITLFEHVHSVADRAYLTIGTVARMAYMLELDQPSPRQANQAQSEERNRAWWAIVLLDGYIAMSPSGTFRHRAVGYPWSEDTMSVVNTEADGPSKNKYVFPVLSIQPALGEIFQIEAEAIWNFAKVQDYMRRNEHIEAPNFKKALEIDRDLSELLVKIQNKLRQQPKCVSGFATCMSGLLMLHIFCLLKARKCGEQGYCQVSLLSLQDLTHGTARIADKMATDISQNALDITQNHPSWIIAMFQAALGQKFLMDIYGLEARFSIFHELLQMFSVEWPLACHCLDLLHGDHNISTQYSRIT